MNPTLTFETHRQLLSISKKRRRRKKLIIAALPILLLISTITIAPLIISHKSKTRTPSSQDPHLILRSSCSNTRYPSFCFSTLASIPASKNATTRKQVLGILIDRTVRSVKNSHSRISKLITSRRNFNSHQKTALYDCLEMLNTTISQLQTVTLGLHDFPAKGSFFRRTADLKTLLSAAMTNQDTCLEEFSEDEKLTVRHYLKNRLVPISRMLSSSLAMVKNMEDRESFRQRITTVRKFSRPVVFPGSSDGFPTWVAADDRKLLGVDEIPPDLVVSGDGSSDFPTISQAVARVPDFNRKRFVIRVKAGTYVENVEIPRSKKNVMLVGDGRDNTVIAGSKSVSDGITTFNSATLAVSGAGFMARDLTIINTAGLSKRQAVALRVNSDLSAFYRCNISAYQDTLYVHSLRQFYRDCNIHGTVDFIFGNAAVVFQNCLILARKPNQGQKNMITAQSRQDPFQNTGISIQNCTISAAPELVGLGYTFPTYLGRPWRNHSRTVVMQSYLGDLIHPLGWHLWNKFTNVSSVEYAEYSNRGPGSDTGQRVGWGGFRDDLSEGEAMQFTVGEFIHGGDWLGLRGVPFEAGL